MNNSWLARHPEINIGIVKSQPIHSPVQLEPAMALLGCQLFFMIIIILVLFFIFQSERFLIPWFHGSRGMIQWLHRVHWLQWLHRLQCICRHLALQHSHASMALQGLHASVASQASLASLASGFTGFSGFVRQVALYQKPTWLFLGRLLFSVLLLVFFQMKHFIKSSNLHMFYQHARKLARHLCYSQQHTFN